MSSIGTVIQWALDGKEETCEACGEKFSCGPMTKGGCWCMQETLSPEKLAELKGEYSRCLCPRCLRQAASE